MNEFDRDLAIRTMIGEAASQDDAGMAAVGHVIMNRTRDGRWGSTPREVVLARGQFEPWATRRSELLGYKPESPEYQRAAAVLDKVVAATEDPTGGATHFLNEDIVRKRRGGTLPSWAAGEGQRIGDHTFYKVGGKTQMDTSLFDKYDSTATPKADVAATSAAPADLSLFDKYNLVTQAEKEAGDKAAKGWKGDPSRVSSAMRIAHGVPVLGPIVEGAAAATGAAIQGATGRDIKGEPAATTFRERFSNNRLQQDQDIAAYDEQKPLRAAASDITGTAMLLGPAGATRWGASAMGLTGSSLGARVLKGGSSMAALEVANQYLRGQDPRDQGFLGPVPIAAVTGAAGPIVQHGVEGAVNKLIAAIPPKQGAFAGTNSVTRNRMLEAFEGETTASLAESVAGHGQAGRVMDLNQATRDITGGLADIPGQAKGEIREVLRQRSREAPSRLRETLDRNTVPHTDIAKLATDIDESRRLTVAPLYEQFRNTKVYPTDELKKNIIPRLEAAGAFKDAEELAGISGRSFTQSFFTAGPQKDFPTAEAWDLAKRGLDRRISAAYDKGDNTLGKELVKLKHDMIREVEKSPGGQVWKQARQEFAEHSSLLDQLEAGQRTFQRTMRADDLARDLKGLNASELAARRQGARDEINEMMRNTMNGDTTARNKMLTEAGREKLELLFGKRQADNLIRDLEAEVRLSRNAEEMVGGSPTSGKQARRNALMPPAAENGFLRNVEFTKPSTWIPEWVHPHAIMEGMAAERYARSHDELGRLMQIRTAAPEFRDLVRSISTEGARRAAGSAYAGRAASGAARLTQSTGSTQRNRLTEPMNSEPMLEGGSR